jgi:hypothetical protein
MSRAVSHKWRLHRLNILRYEENLIFFFISVVCPLHRNGCRLASDGFFILIKERDEKIVLCFSWSNLVSTLFCRSRRKTETSRRSRPGTGYFGTGHSYRGDIPHGYRILVKRVYRTYRARQEDVHSQRLHIYWTDRILIITGKHVERYIFPLTHMVRPFVLYI